MQVGFGIVCCPFAITFPVLVLRFRLGGCVCLLCVCFVRCGQKLCCEHRLYLGSSERSYELQKTASPNLVMTTSTSSMVPLALTAVTIGMAVIWSLWRSRGVQTNKEQQSSVSPAAAPTSRDRRRKQPQHNLWR